MVRLARYEWEKNLNLAVAYTEPGLVGQCKSDPFLEAACFSGQSFGDHSPLLDAVRHDLSTRFTRNDNPLDVAHASSQARKSAKIIQYSPQKELICVG
jgi:hypothetical protein